MACKCSGMCFSVMLAMPPAYSYLNSLQAAPFGDSPETPRGEPTQPRMNANEDESNIDAEYSATRWNVTPPGGKTNNLSREPGPSFTRLNSGNSAQFPISRKKWLPGLMGIVA